MSRARRSRRNKRTTDHFTFENEDDNERPTKVPRASSKKPNNAIIELSSEDDDEELKPTGSFSLLVTLHKTKKKPVKEEPTAKKSNIKITTANTTSSDDDDDDDDDDEEDRKPTSSKATTKFNKKETMEEEHTAKDSDSKTATNAKPLLKTAAATKYQAGALFAVRNVASDAKPKLTPNKLVGNSYRRRQSKTSDTESPAIKPAAIPSQLETSTQAKPKENLTEPAKKTTTETGPKKATASSKVAKPTPMPAAFAVITEAPVATYDSDEEPPKDDPQKCFQWRGDPSVTLSDWTIEIVSDDTVDTYNVHKVILSYGERHSKYFLNLFCRGRRYTELESNTSRIPLDALAAKAFPKLLDFVYKTDGKEELDINTDTATALHHLGSYFQMPHLRWEAKQFWKKDLCLANATTYFQHARVFQDDKILDAVAEVFAKNIMEIEPSSTIMEISDAAFWASLVAKIDVLAPEPNEKAAAGQTTGEKVAVVPKPGGTPTGAPETDVHLIQNRLSELIVKFAMEHVDELDLATFRAMTAPEKLPIVSKKAAMSLMEVEEAITSKTNEKGSLILRDRCVTAIASDWQDMGGMIESSFKKMKRPFLSKLLEKSLENASDDYQKMEKAKTEALKAKEDSDIAHAKEMAKLKNELSNEKQSWQSVYSLWKDEQRAHKKLSEKMEAAELELAQLRSMVPECVRPEPYNKKSKKG